MSEIYPDHQNRVLDRKYVVTADKPTSSDYCRGCHMATYNSDTDRLETDNRNEVAEFLTKYWMYETDTGEAGYETVLYGHDWEDNEKIVSYAKSLMAGLVDERNVLNTRKKDEEAKEKEQYAEKQRRKEYSKLKEEFG